MNQTKGTSWNPEDTIRYSTGNRTPLLTAWNGWFILPYQPVERGSDPISNRKVPRLLFYPETYWLSNQKIVNIRKLLTVSQAPFPMPNQQTSKRYQKSTIRYTVSDHITGLRKLRCSNYPVPSSVYSHSYHLLTSEAPYIFYTIHNHWFTTVYLPPPCQKLFHISYSPLQYFTTLAELHLAPLPHVSRPLNTQYFPCWLAWMVFSE